MTTLTITTCQASIAEPAVAEITRYLSQRLGLGVRFINDIAWQEREQHFDAGAIDIAWICGAPYVHKMTRRDPIELLAAPVYAAPRYMNRPVYFSDVMVRHDSAYQTFTDLRGARWAYNTIGSHSGYQIVRYHLAKLGLNGDFFGKVICSGAHQHSMEMIADGEIDASAIDTTVFDAVCKIQPELCRQLRVIEVLGPSSQPPWVIATHVREEVRLALRAALTHMHADDAGRAILHRGGFARFACVLDSDYDDIREVLRIANGADVVL